MPNKYLALQKDVFDISKVTVVGSPTITSDGVASGFSGSNYIEFDVLTGNNFTYEQEIIAGNDISGVQIFAYVYHAGLLTDRLFDLRLDKGTFCIVYKNASSTTSVISDLKPVVPNTKYIVKVEVANGTLNYYIDNLLVYSTNSLFVDGFSKIQSNLQNSDVYFKGQIDLPSFKVTTNGTTFSPTKPTYLLERRKEGFDLSKFTVVGSPTITEDGVASGFSTTANVITIPDFNLEEADSWEIEGVVQVFSDNESSACVWLSPATGNGIILPCTHGANSQNIDYQLYLSSNSSSWNISNGSYITFPSGAKVKCNLKFTGTQYIYTCTNLGTNEVKTITVKSSLKVYQSPTQLCRKRAGDASDLFDGSINLPSISFTVDGKEVFTGAKEKFYMLRR